MGVVVATLTNVRLLDVRGTDGQMDTIVTSAAYSKLRLTPIDGCLMFL